MDFGHVAIEMVTVSLPILLGWAVSKLGLMTGQFERDLSKLVLNVALPCLILSSMFGNQALPTGLETAQIMLGSAALYVIAFAVGLVLCVLMRAPNDARASYQFIVTFGNCGFIGFPVISAVLGQKALLYAAVGLIPCNFFIYTVGILLFAGVGGGWRKTAQSLAACCKTPTLLASFVVLICLLTRVTNWGFLGDSISLVGQLSTPAALLLMGASISHFQPLSMLENWRAYVAAAGRLVVAPLVGLAALRLTGMDSFIVATIVLESAMPVATNGTLYAIQYGADTQPMMQGTFISILAAIATIPLVTVVALG